MTQIDQGRFESEKNTKKARVEPSSPMQTRCPGCALWLLYKNDEKMTG